AGKQRHHFGPVIRLQAADGDWLAMYRHRRRDRPRREVQQRVVRFRPGRQEGVVFQVLVLVHRVTRQLLELLKADRQPKAAVPVAEHDKSPRGHHLILLKSTSRTCSAVATRPTTEKLSTGSPSFASDISNRSPRTGSSFLLKELHCQRKH